MPVEERDVDKDYSDSSDPRHRWEPARVESYAGWRDEETPRAVRLGGIRFPVAEVLSRARVRDYRTGSTVEAFECLLEAGWTISLERLEDGSWRVRRKVFIPRADPN